MLKLGIISETKNPVDNRVALTPKQIAELKMLYPNFVFKVQSSKTRAYSDDEYLNEGVEVCSNIANCDILIGIKEASIESLIANKHYIFFGHIAKRQLYNKPLLKAMVNKKLTFSDWEYITDDNGDRLVAFGWYAGVVGVYYTLRGWGKKTKQFDLPVPDINFSKEKIIQLLKEVNINGVKILVTGEGRVSKGAQYILDNIGAIKVSVDDYLATENPNQLIYTVAGLKDLVKSKDGSKYSRIEFKKSPRNYISDFNKFTTKTDILISCHFWANNQPVYLEKKDFKSDGFRIKMIGDITCDIEGSIKSTLRPSTHDNPFYDYNPLTEKEEVAFSSTENITVMAVDTCPNALPRETSEYFGAKFIKDVLPYLIDPDIYHPNPIDRSTIIDRGNITPLFDDLNDFMSDK